MQAIMQKCSIDSIKSSFWPKNVDNIILSKKENGIEKVDNCCCVKLSKYNSLLLHELPIPSLVKNIVVNETTHQHESILSKKHVRL